MGLGFIFVRGVLYLLSNMRWVPSIFTQLWVSFERREGKTVEIIRGVI